MNSSADFVKVKTPGKLILSGEHAVLHGYPALAIAVNRYTETTARWSTPFHFNFNFMGIDFKRRVTLQALKKLKTDLNEKYSLFTKGDIHIRDVLKHPFELSLFTFINVIERIKRKLPTGIDIVTDSNIPSGCGMGSSAANVVSIIYALAQFLDTAFSLEECVQLGIESENLQHGYSSGLDVNTVYHGGCIRFQKGLTEKLAISNLAMQLVHTGLPLSTTGECVMHTFPLFKEDAIGESFSAVTSQFQSALIQNNQKEIEHCVRENHRLLKTIGVVPQKVSEFIAHIEKAGGAAKICGAGSIRGDAAGMVVIFSEQDFSDLAKTFHYPVMPIQIDSRGTHVI